jgi:hypothetical protein
MFKKKEIITKIFLLTNKKIPFFPICQKDLYFIKEHGDTNVDGLVNKA